MSLLPREKFIYVPAMELNTSTCSASQRGCAYLTRPWSFILRLQSGCYEGSVGYKPEHLNRLVPVRI